MRAVISRLHGGKERSQQGGMCMVTTRDAGAAVQAVPVPDQAAGGHP